LMVSAVIRLIGFILFALHRNPIHEDHHS
jgi:hypothetical protein